MKSETCIHNLKTNEMTSLAKVKVHAVNEDKIETLSPSGNLKSTLENRFSLSTLKNSKQSNGVTQQD